LEKASILRLTKLIYIMGAQISQVWALTSLFLNIFNSYLCTRIISLGDGGACFALDLWVDPEARPRVLNKKASSEEIGVWFLKWLLPFKDGFSPPTHSHTQKKEKKHTETKSLKRTPEKTCLLNCFFIAFVSCRFKDRFYKWVSRSLAPCIKADFISR
jgi:hypothetical protein